MREEEGGKLLRESLKEFHLIRRCEKVANVLRVLTERWREERESLKGLKIFFNLKVFLV